MSLSALYHVIVIRVLVVTKSFTLAGLGYSRHYSSPLSSEIFDLIIVSQLFDFSE